MERPNIPPWSSERRLLTICNHLFTVVFTMEMAMKAVAFSLVIGENCYFSDNWHRMDGTLVIVGIIDTLGRIKILFQYFCLLHKVCNFGSKVCPQLSNRFILHCVLQRLHLLEIRTKYLVC